MSAAVLLVGAAVLVVFNLRYGLNIYEEATLKLRPSETEKSNNGNDQKKKTKTNASVPLASYSSTATTMQSSKTFHPVFQPFPHNDLVGAAAKCTWISRHVTNTPTSSDNDDDLVQAVLGPDTSNPDNIQRLALSETSCVGDYQLLQDEEIHIFFHQPSSRMFEKHDFVDFWRLIYQATVCWLDGHFVESTEQLSIVECQHSR